MSHRILISNSMTFAEIGIQIMLLKNASTHTLYRRTERKKLNEKK